MNTDKNLLLSFYILTLLFVFLHACIVWLGHQNNEFDFGDSKQCFLWIGLTYVLLLIFSYVIEGIIINNSSNRTDYKDVTLEFQNLPLTYTEKEFQLVCNEIFEHSVVEVSFLFDLQEYFSIKEKLDVVLKERHDSSEPNEGLKKLKQQEQLEELSEGMEEFQQKFKKSKELYFTGRGFVTFKNFKYAYLFKMINDRMHKKKGEQELNIFVETKPKKRFQSVVNKLILNKTLRE